MKLLFFSPCKCGHLKWPSMNFDSRWVFSYEHKRGELDVKDGVEIPFGFWSVGGERSVESVSAVVGQNGAGKTSLAHAISNAFVNGRSQSYLAIVEIDDKIRMFAHLDDARAERVCSMLKQRFGDRFDPERGWSLGEVSVRENSTAYPEVPRYFIYLSPHMTTEATFRYDNQAPKVVYDYSTTGLLGLIAGACAGTEINPLKHFNAEEKRRVLQVIHAFAVAGEECPDVPAEPMNIVRREQLVIRINTDAIKQALEILKRRPDSVGISVAEVAVALWSHPLVKGRKSNWSLKAFAGFSIIYWAELPEDTEGKLSLDNRGKELLELGKSIVAHVDMSLDGALRLIEKWVDGWRMQPDDSIKTLTSKRLHGAKVVALWNVMGVLKELTRSARYGKVTLPLRTLSQKELAQALGVVTNYAETIIDREYLIFDIAPRLSSGEMAFLTMWGRLYEFVQLRDSEGFRIATSKGSWGKSGKLPYDLLLFMDESEITLHPEWQRKLVHDVLWFFERLAPRARVHVIFASHSPILLSDIPKGNVIFLPPEGEDGRRFQDDLKRLDNSFAADVFDLYRLPFFMRDGAIGMFADEVVRRLTVSQTYAKDDIRRCTGKERRRLIGMIGDPVVRGYLERHNRSNDLTYDAD